MNNKDLSLLMPVYNEASTIKKTIEQYWKFLKDYKGAEFLVVEDGSTDGTKEILKSLNKKIPFKLVTSSKRKGYTKAVMDALKISKRKVILFSDSDGQHTPEDFKKLLPYYPEFDLVIGRKSPRNDPLYRNVVSNIYNSLVNILFSAKFQDIDSGFRLIKQEVIKDILPKTGKFRYCYFSEFTIMALQKGYKVEEVPIKHFPREIGQSTIFSPFNLPKVGFGLFIQLLKLRKSVIS